MTQVWSQRRVNNANLFHSLYEDPDSQVIRSWVFTSAGRFAEGTWSRTNEGWRVRFEGRGADMGRVSECVLASRGPDAMAVSGARDGLAADFTPVCDVVRVGH